MLHTWINIRSTPELAKIKELTYKAPLLLVTWSEVTYRGGNKVVSLKLVDVPVLYEISNYLNQVTRVPLYLLKSKEHYTDLGVVIRNYLLFRIECMKNRNNKIASKDILYTTLYDELFRSEVVSKKMKEMVKKKVSKVLDSFVNQNYIENYSIIKEGNATKKIAIIF